MNKNKLQIFSELILFISFLLVIYVPSITMLFSSKSEISKTEKRKLSTMPKLELSKQSLEKFPSGFEAYVNDHFGLRSTHILVNSYLKVKWLGVSPVGIVLLGKENWLYLNRWDSIEDYMGLKALSRIQMELWKNHFQKKRNWLAKQGIQYLFVIVPDKQMIYPEHLPYYISKVKKKTRLDCLLEYFNGEFDSNILDLRSSFLEAKKNDLLYFKTDQHWNLKGAYLGYRKILDRIRSRFPDDPILGPLSISEIKEKSSGLGLAITLGLQNFYQEINPSVYPQKVCSKMQKDVELPQITILKGEMPFSMGCPKSNLRAVVFRDSFCSSMVPFLSEHFKQVVYVWHPYDQDTMKQLVEKIKPDIVIEVSGESVLFWEYSIIACHNMIGKDLLEKGETRKAIAEFKKVLKLYPGNPDGLNNIGFALMKEKKFDEAILLFKKILNKYPDHIHTRNNLQVAVRFLQEIDLSMKIVQAKIKLEPGNPDLHHQLGRLNHRKGDFMKAAIEYRKAIEIKPDFVEAIYNLAIMYAAQKEYDSALGLFKRMIALTPNNLDIYYNIACMYAGQHKLEESIKWLNKAIDKGYDKWDLIKTDKDLANIRNSKLYKDLIFQNN